MKSLSLLGVMKSLQEEAIRNTHRKMIQKHPEHKKIIDIILKVKLEALENC